MSRAGLAAEHQRVLSAWREVDPELGYLSFRGVSRRSGVGEDKIRRIVRHLARKGLLQFGKGLWDEDGPRGAGYGLTPAGRTAIAATDAEGGAS